MPWIAVDRWEEPEWTLGWQVAEWVETYLRVPGGPDYGKPLVLTGWQLRALVDLYAVDRRGEWLFRRAQVRLAKGTGKSPWAAAFAAAELCGPARWAGWDARGEPVGAPVKAPLVQIAACSEDQAGNTYSAFRAMLEESPLVDDAGIDVGITRTILRGRPGSVVTVTASAGSREGQPVTAVVCDETHLWSRSNGGRKLYATLRRNAAKMGARVVATTNAFDPGAESVAEQIELAALTAPGTMIYGPQFEAHVDDLTDLPALRAGLERAYRDAPWVNIDRLLAEAQDPDVTAEDVHRFYLNCNRATASVLCESPRMSDVELEDGAPIAVGFDGSRKRDATAVVGVHMVTGVAYLLGYWERPVGVPHTAGWEVPERAADDPAGFPGVLDVWEACFDRFKVARFKADRSGWWDQFAWLQNEHGKSVVDRMPVDRDAVTDQAIRATQNGLEGGQLLLSAGAESEILAAQVKRCSVPRRMVGSRELRVLVKQSGGAGDRNDAAAALIYAVQARHEALTAGWEPAKTVTPILVWGDD